MLIGQKDMREKTEKASRGLSGEDCFWLFPSNVCEKVTAKAVHETKVGYGAETTLSTGKRGKWAAQ